MNKKIVYYMCIYGDSFNPPRVCHRRFDKGRDCYTHINYMHSEGSGGARLYTRRMEETLTRVVKPKVMFK